MFSHFSLRTIALYALLMLVLSAACLPDNSRDTGADIRRIAGPHALNLLTWELQNTFTPVGQGPSTASQTISSDVLARDIEQVLAQHEIVALPHVWSRLQEPPLLLVVSPRERILYQDRLLLWPGLDAGQVEEIESGIGRLGLSALVVKLGGFGAAYPGIVSPSMPLKEIINVAVEEWAHQYMALRPLGFLYLLDCLGFSQDPGVITMNETLAGMMADEIGAAVYRPYDKTSPEAAVTAAGFDFDGEMRLTRRHVDELLAGGKVDEAEAYMGSRRIFFNDNGYHIRKLNQAYFAFHGIYGGDPGSASPVYGRMKALRGASASLAEFVDRVSAMTRYSQLEAAVQNLPR